MSTLKLEIVSDSLFSLSAQQGALSSNKCVRIKWPTKYQGERESAVIKMYRRLNLQPNTCFKSQLVREYGNSLWNTEAISVFQDSQILANIRDKRSHVLLYCIWQYIEQKKEGESNVGGCHLLEMDIATCDMLGYLFGSVDMWPQVCPLFSLGSHFFYQTTELNGLEQLATLILPFCCMAQPWQRTWVLTFLVKEPTSPSCWLFYHSQTFGVGVISQARESMI